ncbi:DUF4267 domain-containing protein [Humibacter sp.]|uniref:DUF4267 domain-containing protein n=1 Tax=Humibacter sp. TaxID=1940291 RepID=UPI003F7E10B2
MYIAAATLTLLGSALIMWIGVSYIVRPTRIAAGFGFRELPAYDNPYFRIKGVRDVVSGMLALAMLTLVTFAIAAPIVLGVYMLVGALVPIGDMLVVLRYGGRTRVALGMHGLSAAVAAVTGVLWLTT